MSENSALENERAYQAAVKAEIASRRSDTDTIEVTMPEDAWFDAQHRVDVVTYDDSGPERRYVRRWYWATDVEVEAAWTHWGERGDWNAALPLYFPTQRKASAMVIHAHLDRERGVRVIDSWPPSRIDAQEVVAS
jgi:hypothetical protein